MVIQDLVYRISATNAELKTVVRDSQQSIRSLMDTVGKSVRSLENASRKMYRRGTILFTGISVLTKKTIDSAASFEKSMRRVQAVSQATASEYRKLSDTALEMSTRTEHSATAIAEGMNFMAMAGFKANEIMEAMPSVLQLASAGVMDLGTAADITTNILTGYGLELSELARANDILVSAMTGANVDLVDLGESFKYVGPLAKAAGIEFNETAAMIALMGNAGIQGSMAGTSLRQAITNLLNPTKQARDVMDRLGIKIRDANDNLLSMTEILRQLEDRGASASDMMILFGQRAGPAMSALLEQGVDELEKFQQRLEDSEGLAARIEAMMVDTAEGQKQIFKNTVNAIRIMFGQDMIPYYRTAVFFLQGIADRIKQMEPEQRLQIIRITAITGAVVGLVTVLGFLGTAIAGIVKGFLTFGSALMFIMSMKGLVIGSIILAVGLLKKAWENDWLSIRTITEDVVDQILALWDSLLEWWDRSKLRQWIIDTWEQIRDVWQDEDLTLGQKVLETVSIVANGIVDLIPGLREIWDTWTDDDLNFGQKVLNTISIVVKTVTDLIESINAWWTKQVVKLARKTAEILGLDPDEAWFVQLAEDLNEIWTNEELTFGEKVIESFKLIPGAQAITDFIEDVKDKIVNSKAWQWTVDVALPVIVDGGETVIKAIVEVGGRMYDAIKKGLDTGDWSDFWDVAEDIWSTGVLIAVSLSGAVKGISIVLNAIKTGLGLVAATLGMPGILGLISVGIQLKEAQEEGSYEDFAQNVILAALAGVLVGLAFDPKLGMLAFTVAINFKLGRLVEEGIYSFAERLGLPRSHLQMVEEYTQYTQEMYEEATKDMNWLQKRLWTLAGNKPEGLLDFPEWKEAMGYVTEELNQYEIDPQVLESVKQFAKELAELYPQYSWQQIEDIVLEKAFQLLDSPTAFHEIMNVVNSFVSEVERIENAIDELSREMGVDLRSIPLEDISKLVVLLQNEYESIFEDIVKYHGVSPGRLIAQLISPELPIDEAVSKTIKETADDVERLTGELSRLEKQALIVAETLRQGGTLEQALAILGIAYWETRGYGGYTHIDPATGEVIRGSAGEYGIGQVMPGTGKDVWTRLWKQPAETWDESMLEDLDTNIAMMVSYFLDRYRVHGQDLRLAIEGYNRGTAIDGMQAYTVGVVEWMEGPEGKSFANILYDGMENALEAMIQAGYDMGEDVRQMAAFIAQSIANYLVGESPPPEGPLSNIKIGMKNTMDAGIEGVEEGLLGGIGRILSSAQKIGEAAKTWGRDLISYFMEGVEEEVPNQQSRMEKIASRILMPITFDNPENDLWIFNSGVDLMKWFGKGISSAAQGVVEIAKMLIDNVFDAILKVIRERYPELIEFFNDLKAEVDEGIKVVEEFVAKLGGDGEDEGKKVIKELDAVTTSWLQNLSNGLASAIVHGENLYDVFDSFLRMIAQQTLSGFFMRGFTNILSTAGYSVPTMHFGGLVMHSGGIIEGLRPDEVPIIAQKGERILSRKQNDRFEQMLEDLTVMGGQNINLNIYANDAKSFVDMVRRNPEAIVSVLVDDYRGNGIIRRLVRGG